MEGPIVRSADESLSVILFSSVHAFCLVPSWVTWRAELEALRRSGFAKSFIERHLIRQYL